MVAYDMFYSFVNGGEGELITVETVVGGASLLIPHSTHSINLNSVG
jgi:hypothetical protein